MFPFLHTQQERVKLEIQQAAEKARAKRARANTMERQSPKLGGEEPDLRSPSTKPVPATPPVDPFAPPKAGGGDEPDDSPFFGFQSEDSDDELNPFGPPTEPAERQPDSFDIEDSPFGSDLDPSLPESP